MRQPDHFVQAVRQNDAKQPISVTSNARLESPNKFTLPHQPTSVLHYKV
jgi:hypothetical protein